MHPLNRAAGVAALFLVLGTRAGARPSGVALPDAAKERPGGTDELALSSVCPRGTLPDGAVCVPIPDQDELGADELVALPGAHFDKRGRFSTYDQIPRRPDRPADYAAYRYPIAVADSTRLIMSGYDLDLPDAEQRRGRKFSHVGHGGVDLPAPRGTEVHLLPLEHQEGDAEVLFSGRLFGTTVVTKHTLREGGRLRDYIVLYGHLDRIAPSLALGPEHSHAPGGTLLGYVGDTGSEGIVHLHFEVRRVRDGIDLAKTLPGRLVANEVSIVCDPRNVLPLQ